MDFFCAFCLMTLVLTAYFVYRVGPYVKQLFSRRRWHCWLHPEENLRYIQEDIGRWAEETFGDRTSNRGTYNHMKSEIEELGKELGYDGWNKVLNLPVDLGEMNRAANEEQADIVIVNCHLAARRGFSMVDYVIKKMEKNRNRTWGKADPVTGVIHHTNAE